MLIKLLIDTYDGQSHQEIILSKARFTIGRKAGNDLYINRPEISGTHAEFTIENGEYYITDLGSTNGTLLNGAQLLSNQRYLLQNHDVLTIGPIRVTYVVEHDTMETMYDSPETDPGDKPAPVTGSAHHIATGTEEHLKPDLEEIKAPAKEDLPPEAPAPPAPAPEPEPKLSPPPPAPVPALQPPQAPEPEQPQDLNGPVLAPPIQLKTTAASDYLWIAIGLVVFLAAIGFVLFLILEL